jgi:hypothetical protein
MNWKTLLLLGVVIAVLVLMCNAVFGADAPTTAPAPHVRSWGNPEDVQWFLLWFFGPTGAVIAIIGLYIATKTGKIVTTVVQPQMAEAKVVAAEAKGKADAMVVTAQNLATTNERQQKNLDELNKATDPNKTGT